MVSPLGEVGVARTVPEVGPRRFSEPEIPEVLEARVAFQQQGSPLRVLDLAEWLKDAEGQSPEARRDAARSAAQRLVDAGLARWDRPVAEACREAAEEQLVALVAEPLEKVLAGCSPLSRWTLARVGLDASLWSDVADSDAPTGRLLLVLADGSDPAPERLTGLARYLPVFSIQDIDRLLDAFEFQTPRRGLTFEQLAEAFGATGDERNLLDVMLNALRLDGHLTTEGRGNKQRYRPAGTGARRDHGAADVYWRGFWTQGPDAEWSARDLAAVVGLGAPAVQEHLNELREAGFLVRTPSKRHTRSDMVPFALLAQSFINLGMVPEGPVTVAVLIGRAMTDAGASCSKSGGKRATAAAARRRRALLHRFVELAIGQGFLATAEGRWGIRPSLEDADELGLPEHAWFALRRCRRCGLPWGEGPLGLAVEPDGQGKSWASPCHVECPPRPKSRPPPPLVDNRTVVNAGALRGQHACARCSKRLGPVTVGDLLLPHLGELRSAARSLHRRLEHVLEAAAVPAAPKLTDRVAALQATLTSLLEADLAHAGSRRDWVERVDQVLRQRLQDPLLLKPPAPLDTKVLLEELERALDEASPRIRRPAVVRFDGSRFVHVQCPDRSATP